jgi:hypothetical protein
MIPLHIFYREYEKLSKDDRFRLIDSTIEPTSLFVIFKMLGQVRSQKKYFEDREAHLLELAEKGFNNLKKNG